MTINPTGPLQQLFDAAVLDDLVISGPTLTNVNDIRAIIITA